MQRDLDRVGQDVEALESVHAGAGLTEPSRPEDPRIEQIEDARRVGEEPVLARPGEDRLARRQAEHGLPRVPVERGERGRARDGPAVGVVVGGRRARADVRGRRQQIVRRQRRGPRRPCRPSHDLRDVVGLHEVLPGVADVVDRPRPRPRGRTTGSCSGSSGPAATAD